MCSVSFLIKGLFTPLDYPRDTFFFSFATPASFFEFLKLKGYNEEHLLSSGVLELRFSNKTPFSLYFYCSK